jgi:hypothetical protein
MNCVKCGTSLNKGYLRCRGCGHDNPPPEPLDIVGYMLAGAIPVIWYLTGSLISAVLTVVGLTGIYYLMFRK